MRTVNFLHRDGSLEEKTQINITKEDWERYYRILDKYIKGLFYTEFNAVFPTDYKIHHRFGRESDKNLLRHIGKWNKDNKKIVAYGFSQLQSSYKSIWAIIFYDSVFFLSGVNDENPK